MDIRDKITKQAAAGFTTQEIFSNLRADGHSTEEIQRELRTMPAQATAPASSGPGLKTILWTILVIIAIILKLIRIFS